MANVCIRIFTTAVGLAALAASAVPVQAAAPVHRNASIASRGSIAEHKETSALGGRSGKRRKPWFETPQSPPPLPAAPLIAGYAPLRKPTGGESSKTLAVENNVRSFFWIPVLMITTPALAVTLVLAFVHCCKGARRNLMVKAARAGISSINFSPMLCTFFMAVAESVSNSADEDTAKPQNTIMGLAVYACATFFVLQAVLRICFAYFVLKEAAEGSRAPGQSGTDQSYTWPLACQLSVAAMYVSIFIVMVSLLDYPMNKTSVSCTVVLALSYFLVYLALHLAVFDAGSEYATAVLKIAALNLALAPMFGTLFMTVQVLQEERGVQVPMDIQAAMRLSTTMLLTHTALAALTPLVCNGVLEEVGQSTERNLVIKDRTRLKVLSTLRSFLLLFMYSSVWVVYSDIWRRKAYGIQVSILCGLSATYFGMYSSIWVLMSLDQFDCKLEMLHWLIDMKDFVALVPILSASVLGWWFCVVV